MTADKEESSSRSFVRRVLLTSRLRNFRRTRALRGKRGFEYEVSMVSQFYDALYRGESTDVLVQMVSEFGNDGELLLSKKKEADRFDRDCLLPIDECFHYLSAKQQAEFFRSLIAENPNIPSHSWCHRAALVWPHIDDKLEWIPYRDTFLHRAIDFRVYYRRGAVQPSFEVIQLLAHPKIAGMQDHEGRTPLLLACLRRFPSEVIKFLIDLYPKAVEVPDENGWLPLHHAIRDVYNNTTIFEQLVPLDPATLSRRDKTGNTPIMLLLQLLSHRRCTEVQASVFTRMIRLAPDSVRKTFIQFYWTVLGGRQVQRFETVLHYACEFFPSVTDLILVLIETWPIALTLVPIRREKSDDPPSLLPLQLLHLHDRQEQYTVDQALIDQAFTETKEMLLACVELLLQNDTRAARRVPEPIKNHLKTEIHRVFPTVDLQGASAVVVSQSIRSLLALHPDELFKLCIAVFHNEAMQMLLRKDGRVCDIISGIYRMNKFEQVYGQEKTSPTPLSSSIHQLDHVLKWDCVIDDLDSIFLHERESVGGSTDLVALCRY